MAFLPYWRRDATYLYNVLAFAAFWSVAAMAMGTVGGATLKWVKVRYNSPAEGTSYTKGFWRECTWPTFPGQVEECTYISPSKAESWERACQAFYFLFLFTELIAAVLFLSAMRSAGARAARNPVAKAAGAVSFIAGCFGLIAMSIFVNREPRWDSVPYVRHLHWSYGLFTAAWALAMAVAPIGLAA